MTYTVFSIKGSFEEPCTRLANECSVLRLEHMSLIFIPAYVKELRAADCNAAAE